MKKKVFSLMMMLLLAFMGVAKAETIEIGDGTGTSYYGPYNSLYEYSFVEQVYTASEIGGGGTITAISFNMQSTDSQTNQVDVFMKNVSRSTFSSNTDYEPVTASDMVFSGTVTFSPGWTTITLDTPFAYDGSSNLMIGMHEYTPGYSTRYFYYTDVENSILSYYSDSYNPDPYDLGSYSGTKFNTYRRPNIQIEMTAGGGGETVEVTIGDPASTTSSGYLPTYSLYEYSLSQQIYTADEIGVGGTINSLTMWLQNTSSYARNLNFYLKETSTSAFAGGDWVSMSSSDLVGSITLANGISSFTETTINLSTPFAYTGNGNLVLCVQDVTGSWSSGAYGNTLAANGNQALYAYRDGTVYDPAAPGVSGYTTTSKNVLRLSITTEAGGGQGGFEDKLHVKYMDGETEVIDTLNMGVRPAGCWMEPFQFTMYSEGPNYTVNVLDFTPSDGMFTVEGEELPFQVAPDADVELTLACNGTEAGIIERQFVAITEGDRAAHIWPVIVELYTPECPDVVEVAYELNDGNALTPGFTYAGAPAEITPTVLHNDYTLPFPEIPEGEDGVYKFTVENDVIISAYVGDGEENALENGKVALYTEDFYGEGGPMATNNYTGLSASGSGAAAGPFEALIGDPASTSTTGYNPMYYLYNYSLSTAIYTAAELAEAGATTAPMTSVSWFSNSTYGYNIQNVSIWMANVSDNEVSTMSPLGSGMTLVYEGNHQEVVGENEFVLNQGNFAWDGTSNVIVMVQMNNGSWSSSIQWQCSNPGFNAMSYAYTDNAPYNAQTTSYSMYTSNTARGNILFKGGNRSATSTVSFNFEGGVAGWTDIDNDGDGHTWFHSSYSLNECGYDYTDLGHNASDGFMVSASYNDMTGDYYDADNYLVSPQKYTLGDNASVNFFFDYASDVYPDYFEVCVATADNPGASDFTSIWNTFMRSNAEKAQIRHANNRYENWREVTVDLSTYAGQDVWIAFHHQDIDYLEVWIDDVTINTGGDTPTPTPTPGPAMEGVSAGPVISNLGLTPGTYYLVASSAVEEEVPQPRAEAEENFFVYINIDEMPCPAIEAEGFAFNPEPADDADDLEPASVTLRWMVPEYATGWRLIFGSTYYPDPNHPQTIMYPEDGSFSNDMANSYTVRNLWNNTNYFWHVEFNNDACPDGVSSPIWGFTTHLNIPQNLTVVDETVFNDEQIVLNWTPVVDRTYRYYFIYRDGVKVGETTVNQINLSTYTDGPLAYNMEGYTYYVTAVYDEGESAPSNEVTVKVSGYGNVNGHVYEQDGTTGIAGATVTMVGPDEFGVNHTYNFTTDAQGYYSGAVYAGPGYDGQAAKEGYQTAYVPVQGEPIVITYNQTTSPIDYIMDENFDPVCGVIAEYYPDSLDPNSPYVKVYWGCGLPGSEIIEDFETGDFSMFDWQVDPTYPWTVTTYQPYEGTYCMKSGGAGVANVVSNMTVTVNIPADGLMSFFGKISCESSWDYGYFYIDGVQKGSFTGAGNWIEKTYDVTAGDHTFKWSYTKDGSVNSNDDCFYVDYINFYKQPEPPVPGMTYNFEDGTMQGWTSVDADGDGYGWYMGSEIMTGQTGNNGSSDFVLSQSYYMGTILYPDNYLVSPQVQLGGTLTFYACAQDASYAAEHFGVAVSTTNTNPSSFTMVQEWTMTAKSAPLPKKAQFAATSDVKGMGHSRNGNNREQGNWYQYTVDLSAYSGTGYVAIRHFNCSDMFYLNVDDITIGEPAKSVAQTRSLNHYRVYRTNCYQECPFTEENTVLLATVWVPDTVYIDVEWADLPAGVYKWGVGAVYEGNRGELIEAPINWTAPQVVNRSATADNDPNPVVGEEGNRAPWDLMTTFTAPEAAHYGVVTDGQYIYTSNWGYASATHNFYKYDMQGNMIEGFEITGCGTLRGMTFDGQHIYGVANSNTVYCVDLNSHTLVNTFTSAYGAMRGITYDPERDGFWVIGNWSGNLTLINRSGAVVTTGPEPTSVSDLAYYKDENDVEHVFCFNNGDNGVYDYNITTNTLGGSVFNFSATPGFDAGSSGGCHVAEYNGKMAFFGDIQQDPNLIGIYELRDGGTPGPGPAPVPGGDNCNQLALARESETVWSNCLDKDMYIIGENQDGVTVNVLLNSADSPEGVQVTFTNYNEAEQELYPIEPIVLDETGFYAFDSFRRGNYKVNVTFDGYEPIEDSVSIWEPVDLRYVMTEIIYGVSDLYVSSTGWAMWGAEGLPPTPGPGPGPGPGPQPGDDVTIILTAGDVWGDGSGYQMLLDADATAFGTTIPETGALSTNCSGNEAIYAEFEYKIPANADGNCSTTNIVYNNSVSITIPAGTYDWCITNPTPGDRIWIASEQGNVGGRQNDYTFEAGNTYEFTVTLQGSNDATNVTITGGAKNMVAPMPAGEVKDIANVVVTNPRHLEYFKVMCTSIDGEPIFNADTEHPFCQVATDQLVPGEHYIAKVAAMYSTGMSAWTECEWQYIPCDNYAGTLNGVEVNGTEISWDYPGGSGPVPPQPGQGDSFSVDFEAGLPAGWTTIDGGSPTGYGWHLGSTTLGTGYGHNGSGDLMISQSYDNNYGIVYPDNYLVSPQVTLAAGSTFSFYACAQDASYAAEHFGVFVSDNGTSNWTMVNEWTIGQKGERYNGPRGNRDQSAWTLYSVDLSNFAGQKYIAIRHFNCSDQYFLDVDDVELTSGAKSNRAAWDLMMTFNAAEAGHYGLAYDGTNFYTSNWGYSSAAYNFYKYDLTGNMIEGFNISGCGTLRGMTYDGEHFYGVANSNTVYCVDLANHSVVSTFTSSYGAMRGITYDPVRDGFWVIGNWSGNLTLIDRTGAVQQTGPAPESASDLAYYKDENDVEHIYCFNNGTNDVNDWVIGNGSMGGSVFNFNNLPGTTGTSGGCNVASFNGKIAFMGDIQQDPNLIGIYELRDDNGGPVPPVPPATGDIIGAMIFVDGEWVAEVPYPTNTYTYEGEGEEVCVRMIYNGTNNLPEGNIYYSMSCPECEALVPGPGTCEPGAPIHSELVDANHIKVWWGNAPAAPVSDWLYYDDGTNEDAIGLQNGGSFYWGIKFPAAAMSQYEGCSVTKIGYFDYAAHTGTVRIYNGSNGNAPGTLIGTYDYTATGTSDWVEWTIPAVAFDNTQDLWIVMNNANGQYVAAVGPYTGDPNGTMISTDGSSWYTLEDATGGQLSGTWNLRCYVTNQAKGGEIVALDDELNGTPGGVIANSGVSKHGEAPAYMTRAELVKYNVYRSTEATGTYILIGEVAATGADYYEYIDSPTEAGTYYYQVRAEYDNECESEPAQAADDPSVNYVSETTTAAGVDENGSNVALYPNPTKGNVTIEAEGMSRITVVSVLGQVVFDTELDADTYTLNMSQFNAGMYMVRVYTEGGVTVKRVTVMR